MAIVNDALPGAELIEIEQRVSRALDAVPSPWNPMLETRHGIGGCSFIEIGDDLAGDKRPSFDHFFACLKAGRLF
jgi:hypothetical protein